MPMTGWTNWNSLNSTSQESCLNYCVLKWVQPCVIVQYWVLYLAATPTCSCTLQLSEIEDSSQVTHNHNSLNLRIISELITNILQQRPLLQSMLPGNNSFGLLPTLIPDHFVLKLPCLQVIASPQLSGFCLCPVRGDMPRSQSTQKVYWYIQPSLSCIWHFLTTILSASD